MYPEVWEFKFYLLKFYFVCIGSPPSIFSDKCHVNSCLLNDLNTCDKLMWHLIENINEMVDDANEIEVQGIKFKFWNFEYKIQILSNFMSVICNLVLLS